VVANAADRIGIADNGPPIRVARARRTRTGCRGAWVAPIIGMAAVTAALTELSASLGTDRGVLPLLHARDHALMGER